MFAADHGKNNRASQGLLDDDWEPEPIEALTGNI
jgi:hypothetical protein